MNQVNAHDILARLAAATASPNATAAAPGDLIRLVQDVKRAPDSVCVELLNAGAAEALLTVLLPQPGSMLAVGAKDAIVLPIVEALSHFAAALGYGSQSPALPVDADRLHRQSHSLSQVLGAGDPLLHAFSQSVGSPLAWIAEYAGSEARGGAGRTFDARARRITQLTPLLHASFLFDPSKFILEGMRCGYIASLMIMLEEIVSVLFLLLPKAIRQQCTQEWACIVRSTTYLAGTVVPAYEAGWDAINNRVKSTNKFGLDIVVVMSSLAALTHFLFLVASYPACEHELKKTLQGVAVVPQPVVAIITQATHILERCADYLYHACRMLIRWIPLTKFKASILLSMCLWVEATLAENHPAVGMWTFWWQPAWWIELAARCKGIPASETHMDLPAWLIIELRMAAASAEALLLKTSPPALAGRRLFVVKGSCCAERRAAALEQFSSILLQHPSPADLSCIGTPLGLGSGGQLGGASTIVAGSRDRAAFAASASCRVACTQIDHERLNRHYIANHDLRVFFFCSNTAVWPAPGCTRHGSTVCIHDGEPVRARLLLARAWRHAVAAAVRLELAGIRLASARLCLLGLERRQRACGSVGPRVSQPNEFARDDTNCADLKLYASSPPARRREHRSRHDLLSRVADGDSACVLSALANHVAPRRRSQRAV
jgi:hypothetical protein